MDYYIEIKILPDPEFKETVLMNAMFAKLHWGLVAAQNNAIGISFPEEAVKSLGTRLRLHGTQTLLNNLMAQKWLKGLNDYTEQSQIIPIPQSIQYRVVQRVQAKSNPERLRRRSVAKGWLTEEEAANKISLEKKQKLKLPFLKIRSSSTNQAFRIFLQHGAIQDEPVLGKFNTYGLSQVATIPWF